METLGRDDFDGSDDDNSHNNPPEPNLQPPHSLFSPCPTTTLVPHAPPILLTAPNIDVPGAQPNGIMNEDNNEFDYGNNDHFDNGAEDGHHYPKDPCTNNVLHRYPTVISMMPNCDPDTMIEIFRQETTNQRKKNGESYKIKVYYKSYSDKWSKQSEIQRQNSMKWYQALPELRRRHILDLCQRLSHGLSKVKFIIIRPYDIYLINNSQKGR
jgi:hypothetical protein